jgi:hypothetical protein
MDPTTILSLAKDAQSVALIISLAWVGIEIKVNHALRSQLKEARKDAFNERKEWLNHHSRLTEVVAAASSAMDTAVKALERMSVKR